MDSSDCCGNGCANCILDQKCDSNDDDALSRRTSCDDHRKNILADGYKKFTLIAWQPHFVQPDVENEAIEMHFKALVTTTDDDDNDDVMLYVPAGHHVMMRINCHNATSDGKHLLRPYSPYWIDVERLEFKILVNLQPRGIMSKYLMNLTTETTTPLNGDQQDLLPEFRLHRGCNYQHEPLSAKHLVLISQGVAIASLIRIIELVLNNPNDDSRITHAACFQDLQHFYFRQRLREYTRYWNYCNYNFVAHEMCEATACQTRGTCTASCTAFQQRLHYNERVQPQRLNAAALQAIIERGQQTSMTSKQEFVFIISGSRTFQDIMQTIVTSTNVPHALYLL